MRVIVTGSRDWPEPETVERALYDYICESGCALDDVVIVHGDCPSGADMQAKSYAVRSGFTHEPHPADWDTYGKRAGFLRNKEMVDAGASVCLAFIKDNSRGATMTMNIATAVGIPTRVFRVSSSD